LAEGEGLAKKTYTLTGVEPISKDFRLRDQMRGAVGSIMDNIAEGFGRASRLEFINCLGISQGAVNELKSQLYRALDAQYISAEKFEELYAEANEVSKMIASFIRYLNTTDIKGQKFKNRSNGNAPN
jgi:four helix bundle protein